jgi:hypothetical protein
MGSSFLVNFKKCFLYFYLIFNIFVSILNYGAVVLDCFMIKNHAYACVCQKKVVLLHAE